MSKFDLAMKKKWNLNIFEVEHEIHNNYLLTFNILRNKWDTLPKRKKLLMGYFAQKKETSIFRVLHIFWFLEKSSHERFDQIGLF